MNDSTFGAKFILFWGKFFHFRTISFHSEGFFNSWKILPYFIFGDFFSFMGHPELTLENEEGGAAF
jgi:hypothetical protein